MEKNYVSNILVPPLLLRLDNSSSPSKCSQMPCMSSWGVKLEIHFLSSAYLHFELQWLNLQLILSSSKLRNASNLLDHKLKILYSSCHPALASYSSVWPCVFRHPPPFGIVPWESSNNNSIKYHSLLACMYQSHMAICGSVLHNMNTGEGVKWSVVEKITCPYLWRGIKMCGCSGHAPVQHSQKVINLERKENLLFCIFLAR